ncbi:MAG: NAD-dependent epimerase/dehydratase family protein [Streptococcus salivarius]
MVPLLFLKMKEYDVKNIVFNQSATVYGTNPSPMTEICQHQLLTHTVILVDDGTNSYRHAFQIRHGQSQIRYFNLSVLASGLIEIAKRYSNNLMPYITQVAGKLPELNVFGDDYPTQMVQVRDYIHVLDLASGHLAAVKYNLSHKGAEIFNLGTDMVIAYWISLRLSKLKQGCYSIPYSRTSCW